MVKRGKIIVIEGTDCSGKETQTNLLIARLKAENIACETLSFPRYDTPTGRIVGECYLGKTGESWFGDANAVSPLIASLYYAADRLAAVPEIEKIINSNKHLILNRYVQSNMAHQGGKERDSEKRKELYAKIYKLEHRALEIPEPDAVFLLYMPYKIGMELKKERPGKADGHESNPKHLKNTEEAYLQLAEMYNWIKIKCAPDNKFPPRTIEDIAEEIYQKVLPILAG
jgi:dTMP kinase